MPFFIFLIAFMMSMIFIICYKGKPETEVPPSKEDLESIKENEKFITEVEKHFAEAEGLMAELEEIMDNSPSSSSFDSNISGREKIYICKYCDTLYTERIKNCKNCGSNFIIEKSC